MNTKFYFIRRDTIEADSYIEAVRKLKETPLHFSVSLKDTCSIEEHFKDFTREELIDLYDEWMEGVREQQEEAEEIRRMEREESESILNGTFYG